MPDPRAPRGVRQTLTSLLLAAIAAVLAGARSLTAVGERVADAPLQVLAALGVRRDPLTRRFELPDEATIRGSYSRAPRHLTVIGRARSVCLIGAGLTTGTASTNL